MNIQSNLQHLNMKLNFPPAVTSLSNSLNDVQKTLLANKIVQGQTRIFQPSQPYIFPGHQQMMQARISFLNTYLRNLRNSTFASEHPQSLTSQGHKDEKMICEKLEFVEKEPEFPVKKESSENHSIQSFSTTTIAKIKQETSHKFTKKDKKSSTQNANDARKRKNYWLPHEDNMLMDLMKTHGQKWTKIAACLEGRTGKQVRDRYLNYLKPSIKQRRWTPEEDELLDKLYKEFGNKWSSIAASLGDRTENQVKNRFYSGVRKGKYVQGKGVVSGNETDQSLKLVKMDPDFETNMTPNLRSEVSSNIDNAHSKDEVFEMCDSLSQSTQSQTKSRSQTQLKEERKNSAESKGATSCFKEFLMEQEFAKYQNKFLENLINTKSFSSERLLLQSSEGSLEDPYKKIKCENLDNEQSINVKQEVL